MEIFSDKFLNCLSEQYGDSFYLLDSEVFEKNYVDLQAAFMRYYPYFNIAYSYKTNYIPKLVKIVDRYNGFAEVVSDLEMDIALNSRVKYERIIWNGPIKDKLRVEELLINGGTVNIDSIEEFEYIKEIAAKYKDKTICVGIRCNYMVGDGVLSRFGIYVESSEFDSILRTISECENIKLVSFQSHFAKRSPEYWNARAEGMIKIYNYSKSKYGIIPERLDLGGGIYGPMPEMLREQLGVTETCYEDYACRAAKVFAGAFQSESDKPMLVIEPGTALAANSMRYVCRVGTIKQVQKKTIATANGSQKNISLLGINPPMEVIHVPTSQHKRYDDLDIAGYTCIESDYLYRGYHGDLGVGDYLVFENCGSYSLVMKPPFIFANVPVIDIGNGKIELIKRAETFEDLFSTYVF